MREPQCSKCHTRFYGDYNLSKNPEAREKDRKEINELIKSLKQNHVDVKEELKKKMDESEEIIRKVIDLLRPE
ncbi:MAG: hypothetical protein ACREBB_01770 [Nitrosotalea sp.]